MSEKMPPEEFWKYNKAAIAVAIDAYGESLAFLGSSVPQVDPDRGTKGCWDGYDEVSVLPFDLDIPEKDWTQTLRKRPKPAPQPGTFGAFWDGAARIGAHLCIFDFFDRVEEDGRYFSTRGAHVCWDHFVPLDHIPSPDEIIEDKE